MDLESNYFLYGGTGGVSDEQNPSDNTPLLLGDNAPEGNKRLRLLIVIVIVLLAILFLVLGIINVIPHKTRFEGGEECRDLYEEKEVENDKGEKEIKKVPTGEKKCVNLEDSYLFEHEKGGDRFIREVKQGLNFTLCLLMIILAIGIYISYDRGFNLKDSSFIKKYKVWWWIFIAIIISMMIITTATNLGAFNKKANKTAEEKMKEKICKEEGILKSYNLCLRSIGRGATDTRKQILDDKNANMVIKKDYDLCTLGFRNKIENDMRPIKIKYDIIREMESVDKEKFVYPGDPDDPDDPETRFKDTYNKYRALGDKVETELTKTESKTNKIGITAKKTEVGTGVFVLDMDKLIARALEEKGSPREQCIIESTMKFQKSDEHKECTKASQEQTNENFKTWKTCSEKENYKNDQQKEQQKDATKKLNAAFTNNPGSDPLLEGDPKKREEAEAALATAKVKDK